MGIVHRSRNKNINWLTDGQIGPYVDAFKQHLADGRYAMLCKALHSAAKRTLIHAIQSPHYRARYPSCCATKPSNAVNKG